MNDYAVHARGLASFQARQAADCPVVIWKRQNVPCIPGSAARRGELAVGGIQLNADFQFEALVASFPDYDDAKSLHDDLLASVSIGYLGDLYRPEAVLIRPGGLQVLVQCAAVTQGA